MLLPFDVGIIYLLDVNKCTHLVSGGIHSRLLSLRFCYGALLSRLLEISAIKISYYYIDFNQYIYIKNW